MDDFQVFIDLEIEGDVGATGAPSKPFRGTIANQEDEDLIELHPAQFSMKQRRRFGTTLILLDDSESCSTTETGTGTGTGTGKGKNLHAAARTFSVEDDVVVLDAAHVKEQQLQKQRATTIDENKRALETVTNTFASIEARMEQALEAAKASLPQSFVAGGNAPLALAADGTENAKSEKQTGRRGKRKVTDFEEERLLDVEAHPILNPGQKRPARTRRAGAEAAPGVPNQAPVLPPPAQGLAPRKGKAAAGAGGERRGGRVPKPKKKAAGGVRRVKAVLPRIPTGPNWISAYGRPEPSAEAILAATKQLFAPLGGRLAFLPKSDAEHKRIMGEHLAVTEVPIVAIHKVVHGPARLAAFEEEARALAQARTGGPNVQVSWHGTSEEALLSILTTGFTASRTVNGKTAGNGLYVAPTNAPNTSMGYVRSDGRVGHMFLLKVILGGVEVGHAGMDLPSDPDLYDSAVDHLEAPSERVVWTPYLYSRILIEYVVRFDIHSMWNGFF